MAIGMNDENKCARETCTCTAGGDGLQDDAGRSYCSAGCVKGKGCTCPGCGCGAAEANPDGVVPGGMTPR